MCVKPQGWSLSDVSQLLLPTPSLQVQLMRKNIHTVLKSLHKFFCYVLMTVAIALNLSILYAQVVCEVLAVVLIRRQSARGQGLNSPGCLVN